MTTSGSLTSLPSLGAWIETHAIRRGDDGPARRSLHWERGLKPFDIIWSSLGNHVAPFIGSVD